MYHDKERLGMLNELYLHLLVYGGKVTGQAEHDGAYIIYVGYQKALPFKGKYFVLAPVPTEVKND